MVANEQVARGQHRHVGSLIACGVGMAVVIAWVLLAKPAEGWFGLPVALVGVPCAIGFVGIGLLVVAERLLAPPVKRSSGVPMLVVEFDDGPATNVLALGEADRLGHVDVLLRTKPQQDQHHAA